MGQVILTGRDWNLRAFQGVRLALHHTFHHSWMSRNVVSVGAQTLLCAALWTPCVSAVRSTLSLLSLTSGKPSTLAGSKPHWFVSMTWASQVVFGISVRLGDSASQPWVDSGVAQGRVLSPLLFNLLVDSLATSLRAAVAGVRLVDSDPFRHVCQLYADDLVLLAESQAHLQDALDVVHSWGLRWRFSFGIGPTKSAVVVFGPLRGRPDCSVHLGGVSLPLVPQYRYLGVTLTPTLSLGVLTLTWSALVVIASSTKRRFASLFLLICIRYLRPFQFVIWSGVRG